MLTDTTDGDEEEDVGLHLPPRPSRLPFILVERASSFEQLLKNAEFAAVSNKAVVSDFLSRVRENNTIMSRKVR